MELLWNADHCSDFLSLMGLLFSVSSSPALLQHLTVVACLSMQLILVWALFSCRYVHGMALAGSSVMPAVLNQHVGCLKKKMKQTTWLSGVDQKKKKFVHHEFEH